MKALCVQMGATPDKKTNVDTVCRLIGNAAEAYGQFDVIVLPELFYCLTNDDEEKKYAERFESFVEQMSPIARHYGSYFVAGSFAEIDATGKVYNTSVVFDRKGEVIGTYRKKHLFDALTRKESEIVSPGEDLLSFETDFGKCGVMICYDLRFTDQWLDLAAEGIDVLLVPAAFYSPRIDHWELLTRNLAMTTQCYVVASNQIGCKTSPVRVFIGRSTIVDPWGIQIATASDKDGYCVAEFDFNYMEDIRSRLPLNNSMRGREV